MRHSPRASQPLRRPTKLDSPGGAPPCVTALVRHSRSDANPYLALAASLACGYLGIENLADPSAPTADTANEGIVDLPRGLLEALA